jgi:hypothetical protein
MQLTETESQRLTTYLNKYNDQIDAINVLLKENLDIFEPTDLKLYDADNHFMELAKKHNVQLYPDSWEFFCRWLHDRYQDERERLGLTNTHLDYLHSRSKFYLSEEVKEDEYTYNTGISYLIYQFQQDNDYATGDITYLSDERGYVDPYYIEEALECDPSLPDDFKSIYDMVTYHLDYVTDGTAYNDLWNRYKDAIKDLELINDFKDRQLEYLEEFFEMEDV